MSIKDDFLEEINEGDYVELVYGSSMQIAGFVIKLTSGMVRIKAGDNSSPRISLDSIISYDTPDAPVLVPDSADVLPEKEKEKEEPVSAPAALPLDDEEMPDDEDIADLKALKDNINDASVHSFAESIISTFLNMDNGGSDTVETVRDRLHDIRAKVLNKLKEVSGESGDLINAVFASMCYRMGDFERAEEHFSNAGFWSEAYYAAYKRGNAEAMKRYLDEYVMDPDILDRYMYRMYADMAVEDKAVSALRTRFSALCASGDINVSDIDEIGCMSECAARIALKGELGFSKGENEDDAAFLKRALSEIGSVWSDDTRKLLEQDQKIAADDGSKRFVSGIRNFTIYEKTAYGYITNCTGIGRDHYFNIRQVNDDLLRKVLAADECYKGLEVSFTLGVPFDPTQEPSANYVQLTERGRKEAEKRLDKVLNKSPEGGDTKGYIESFIASGRFGKIYAGDVPHNFRIDAVTDIKLLAYLLDGYRDSDYASVVFRHKVHTDGKNIALNIRLNDKDIKVSDETVQRLIDSKDITEADIKRCGGEISEDETDIGRLLGYPFEPLAPYVPKNVTEPAKTVFEAVSTAAAPVSVNDAPVSFKVYKHLPKLEPIDVSGHKNLFSSLEPLIGRYYLDARNLLQNNKLEQAEELFIKAIRAKDTMTSAVSDLVGLYLRDNGRILDAVDLIAEYGDLLEDSKRINNLVSIYSKSSERPFMIRCCHVLEEAASMAQDNGKRMHFIYGQVHKLVVLGEYQMALDSANRWHNLYEMEVNYKKSLAVSKYATTLYNIRRYEALCFYCLGDMEKASGIAGELRKLNSSDTLVRAVAEGIADIMMISSAAGLQNSSEADTADYLEYGSEDADTPKYADIILENTKIGDIFKDEFIVDNKYTGSPQKAAELIERYNNQIGKTAKIRSDILFCSAKVINDVIEKHGENKACHITRSDAGKYVGRGFAQLGDATVCDDSCDQMYTPRFYYINAVRMLKWGENDFSAALLSYINSFFDGKQDIAQDISSRRPGKTPKVDWGIFNNPGSRKPIVNASEFAIGIARLYGALKDKKDLSDALKNSGCGSLIIEWVGSNTDIKHGDIGYILSQICNAETESITAFRNELEKVPDAIKVERFLNEAVSGLSAVLDSNSKWLCSEDKRRVNKLADCFVRMSGYHTSNDFQGRESIVSYVLTELGKLNGNISEYPTEFSYEVLSGVIDRAIGVITDMRDRLYSDEYFPDIKFGYTVQPYIDTDGNVSVHLTVSNDGSERQTASLVSVNIAADKLPDGVTREEESSERTDIRGGSSREFIFKFKVSDQIKNIGSFTPSFVCKYGYSKGASEYAEGSAEYSEPVVLSMEDFKEIYNIFKSYDGPIVKNKNMFFGRDDFINKLISEVELPNGNFNYGYGVYLYGQTRAGKSSIRHHFGERLKEHYKGNKDKEVILVDIGDLPGTTIQIGDTEPESNVSRLLIKIIDKFGDEVEANHPELKELIADIDSKADDMKEHPKRARTHFSNYLRKISPYIRLGENNNVQRMIVLVMDEFSVIHTAIKNNALSSDFLKYWKDILGSYPVYMLIFGQDDMPRFVSDHQNEFACMNGSKVTYLSEEYCKKLMEEPIRRDDGSSRYQPEALGKLFKLTGGSAFLTVKLCNFMVEYLNEKRASVITPGIIDGFLKDRIFCPGSRISEADFEPQISDRGDESLRDENKKLLIETARRQNSEGWAKIDDLCPEGMTKERIRQLLERLKERDVILIKENTYCSIVVGMLAQWLLSQYGKEGKVNL